MYAGVSLFASSSKEFHKWPMTFRHVKHLIGKFPETASLSVMDALGHKKKITPKKKKGKKNKKKNDKDHREDWNLETRTLLKKKAYTYTILPFYFFFYFFLFIF